MYGELVVGKGNRGREKFCYNNLCKRDLKILNTRTDKLELLANDCAEWRSTVHKGHKEREKQYFKKSKQAKK